MRLKSVSTSKKPTVFLSIRHKEGRPGWKKGIYPVRCDTEKGLMEDALYTARLGDLSVGLMILKHEPEEGSGLFNLNIQFHTGFLSLYIFQNIYNIMIFITGKICAGIIP